MRPGSFGHSVQTMISPPNRWRLVKSVLFFGIACGILGATIGSAFQALNGARLAAMIGGVPLAIIGSLALGWYGFLFGSVNRLRFGEMLGLVLGLLVGGLVGSVCGLIVLTLPWSLVGALIGGILGSNLTAQAPTFPQTLPWDCPGNLWRDSRPGFPKGPRPRSGRGNQWLAHRGLLRGSGLCWLLICALNLMPKMPMEWDQSHDEPESFGGDDHGPGLRIERRRR